MGNSNRLDFTSSPTKDNPESGRYEGALKPFGSDVKTNITMGSKYKWKPDSNPAPGMYDPNTNVVKSK